MNGSESRPRHWPWEFYVLDVAAPEVIASTCANRRTWQAVPGSVLVVAGLVTLVSIVAAVPVAETSWPCCRVVVLDVQTGRVVMSSTVVTLDVTTGQILEPGTATSLPPR